ncbi:Histone-lysine N-methyltransferase SETMAR [Habropoda laboriosa]|uniref:Histone-lysine N-methyltransferase SETMAR n=1 Tax=Habropoda laboriosa TaxID=597456 RepID=A0A0L7QYZ2_9HYME|nr:Histone-lysine N-methyltransferase SETMAR [Habropoda laboriosa]
MGVLKTFHLYQDIDSKHKSQIIKKLDKWVPLELNERQKLQRQDIRNSLLIRNGRDPFLDRIVTVREADECSLQRSTLRQSRILNLNRKSLGLMLKEINFHPYKIEISRKLLNRDKEAGVEFHTIIIGLLREDSVVLNNFFMTDKA